MPNLSAAKKALRVSERKNRVNQKIKKAYRAAVKSVKEAVAAGDIKSAEKLLPEAQSALDSASKKGTLHKNTVARYKSRLVAAIKKAKS